MSLFDEFKDAINRIQTRKAARLVDLTNKLHSEIINLLEDTSATATDDIIKAAFRDGHKQARHMIAEMVVEELIKFGQEHLTD